MYAINVTLLEKWIITESWACPQCGNTDKEEMQVMRRTCGYISTNNWNKGKIQEINERVMHL